MEIRIVEEAFRSASRDVRVLKGVCNGVDAERLVGDEPLHVTAEIGEAHGHLVLVRGFEHLEELVHVANRTRSALEGVEEPKEMFQCDGGLWELHYRGMLRCRGVAGTSDHLTYNRRHLRDDKLVKVEADTIRGEEDDVRVYIIEGGARRVFRVVRFRIVEGGARGVFRVVHVSNKGSDLQDEAMRGAVGTGEGTHRGGYKYICSPRAVAVLGHEL